MLRDNKIEAIPKELGNCVSLREIALQGNQLQVLPQELSKLSLVGPRNYLKLSGNPLIQELVDRLEKGVKDCLDYISTDGYRLVMESAQYVYCLLFPFWLI